MALPENGNTPMRVRYWPAAWQAWATAQTLPGWQPVYAVARPDEGLGLVHPEPPDPLVAGLPATAWAQVVADETEAQTCLADTTAAPGWRVVVVRSTGSVRMNALSDGETHNLEPLALPERASLYDRHRGLLESDALARRRVLIAGLGSFGAPVAIALAQAGVGRFVLVDPDTLEPANLSRHPCGWEDIGRRKTDAVADRVRAHHPDAEVVKLPVDVNAEPECLQREIAASDLICVLTDENRSRFNLNQWCVEQNKPALFARALTRARGGDVLRLRPGKGPCLACLFAAGLRGGEEEVSTLRQAARDAPAYNAPAERAAQVQPGLAADIAPLAHFVVQQALVLLAPDGDPWDRLREDYTADLYVWANRREGIYADYAPLGFRFAEPAIQRWYGVRAQRQADCLVCAATGSKPL